MASKLMHKLSRLVTLLAAIMPFAAFAAEGYTSDPKHSFVNFSVSHF